MLRITSIKRSFAIYIQIATVKEIQFITSFALQMSEFSLDAQYKDFLQLVKEKIHRSQIQVMVQVNQTLLLLYWEIGNMILKRQKTSWWGSGVIEQLAKDLKNAFPDMKGFSPRNLKYMRRFSREYPDFEIGQQVVAQISRSHNIQLLQKCATREERLWYAQQALEHGRSRNVMLHHIESWFYERQGKALTNFSTTLPGADSDLASTIMKDPYLFDFLNLTGRVKEKELEDALVRHITEFLVELWTGFAYVGRQYPLVVGTEEFRVDLLFYHLKIRCYIVVEHKAWKFKPEYAGKLNFYLSAIDDLVKSDEDNPSIGILLCKGKEGVVAEYAMKDLNKPIGISEYQLMESIPEEFQSKLPSIETLEWELEELGENENFD